ncbi:MAG: hypothetical protein JRI23_07790 [Deltaproteobacteria bacterium]|jgi:uncharacterized membrane protein YkvA (DUF1232 family)|nr:hypothetical protein [Deltaproteobacteria bacterium]MBW2531507.1 hypothetical protein [Deltaproteobacteria bacterium]
MADIKDLEDLPGIPEGARSLWRQLLSQPLVPISELQSELRRYQQSLARSAQWSDEVDPVLARSLGNACVKLLSTVTDETEPAARQAIQAAVRYFILEDDAESDLDSVIGLDDDAEVLNAVLAYLGRSDLTVQVR